MALPQEQIRALDQLRIRLSQLSTQLSLLKGDLERHDPLPQWPALQSSASMLGYHLQQVAEVLSAQQQLFSSMNAYPLSNFPGNTQQHVLEQILRKKLEPRAEDWIADALVIPSGHQARVEQPRSRSLRTDELSDLWDWAGPTSNDMLVDLAQSGAFNIDYSLAEVDGGVENVITGIRRRLRSKLTKGDEDEDDDDGDDDEEASESAEDKMQENATMNQGIESGTTLRGLDPTQPPVPLDLLLRFASTGDFPKIKR